jgi:RNA polymerase sigma-54 factor
MATMRQSQVQKQTNTFLLQQKLQLLHIMHLGTAGLEDYLKNQLEENPALEENDGSDEEADFTQEEAPLQEDTKLSEIEEYYNEDDIPEYKMYVNNSSTDDKLAGPVLAYAPSFREQLKEQLRGIKVTPAIKKMTKYLIDSLDDDGYLRADLDEITDEYGFANQALVEKEELEKALHVLHQFEPAGIGARSLQECLLLQLKRMQNKTQPQQWAERVIEDYFTELSLKNYTRLEKMLHITSEELKEVLTAISHLSPKPVFAAARDWNAVYTIIPDFIINSEDGQLEVSLTSNPSSSVKINDEFRHIATDGHTVPLQKKEFTYFRKKVNEAKWLIEALEQRENTFMEIMKVIATIQKDYFLTGDRKMLKPMILEDVARITGFDISTISRVTCNKYAQTPFGNVLLKDLFSISMINDDGEVVSTEKIKQELLDIVEAENKSKPFTDFDLVKQLKNIGYNLARRTVAKYRESLRIPHARLRKSI